MSDENIKTWPVQLYCRSELGADYWTAHLTQCNDEIEYIRSDFVEQMQIEAIRAALESAMEECESAPSDDDKYSISSRINCINPEHIRASLKDTK